MRRYTKEEVMRESGARPEDLASLEAREMVIPCRPSKLFGVLGGGEEYYTESQLEVLRFIIKTRRVVEANRR